MQFLFFLNPRFWLGAAVAFLALYGEMITQYAFIVLAACIAIGAFVIYFVRYVLKAKGGKK